MKQLKIKICGMRETENIQEVVALQPDFIGFIFYQKSPRFVGSAFQLPSDLGQVKSVGVFVNEELTVLADTCLHHGIKTVQLHGHETVRDCEALKKKGFSVIKAFPIDRDFDFTNTQPYQSVVDYFLFDARGSSYGGNGFPFPWIKLNQYPYDVPFFLSGGLSVNNLPEALMINHPQLKGLDFNSGLEISAGNKSKSLVKLAIETIRSRK